MSLASFMAKLTEDSPQVKSSMSELAPCARLFRMSGPGTSVCPSTQALGTRGDDASHLGNLHRGSGVMLSRWASILQPRNAEIR